MNNLKKAESEKVFYIDEARLQHYVYREYAKAPIGQRITGKVSGQKYVRTSIIAARDNNHKFVAPFLSQGMANNTLVIFWVKELLIPSLPKNSTLIWDNATFHKSNSLREILEKAGHTMIFLPPCSPDLNPIEHKWHELKQRLRSYYDNTVDFTDNLIN